jgi:hypothetical protein
MTHDYDEIQVTFEVRNPISVGRFNTEKEEVNGDVPNTSKHLNTVLGPIPCLHHLLYAIQRFLSVLKNDRMKLDELVSILPRKSISGVGSNLVHVRFISKNICHCIVCGLWKVLPLRLAKLGESCVR